MTDSLRICAHCRNPIGSYIALWHDDALNVDTHRSCKDAWCAANPVLVCKHCGETEQDADFIGGYCESNAGDEVHEMVTREEKSDYDSDQGEAQYQRSLGDAFAGGFAENH